jgi:hypothetical protein
MKLLLCCRIYSVELWFEGSAPLRAGHRKHHEQGGVLDSLYCCHRHGLIDCCFFLQGTWKGGAKGFRLVSLARLSHTKSTDGKSTIMNYLVHLFHTRHEASGDAGALAALQLDEDLASVRLAKNVSVPGACLKVVSYSTADV